MFQKTFRKVFAYICISLSCVQSQHKQSQREVNFASGRMRSQMYSSRGSADEQERGRASTESQEKQPKNKELAHQSCSH